MINGCYYQKMHVNEKGTFAGEVAAAVAPFAECSPTLLAHLKAVEEQLARFRKSLEKLSIADISSQIKADDGERDRGLANLRDYALLCAKRKNPSWAQGGQLIVNAFRKVGWNMDKASYGDETNRVETLLTLLNTEPEQVQAVAAIQAHDWVEQIEEAQLRFRQHSATRIDKMAVEEAKSCSTTEARRLGSAISKLFRLIESEVEFYNRAELNELVVKLNKIIEGYTTLQKQRAARAKRPKSDDTSQQPTA